MKFSELPTGAQFRFFDRGLLHEKVSGTSYAPVTGGSPNNCGPDITVLLEDLPAKPDGEQATPKSAAPRWPNWSR